MRPSLWSRPPSVRTAPVLRRSSMGLRTLVRSHIWLAAGAALRSLWCWPRLASYAAPRSHPKMRLAAPVAKPSWPSAKLSLAPSAPRRPRASCHSRPSPPKPARRPRHPKVHDRVLLAADPPGLHRLRTHRRQGAARVRDASPCCAGSSAPVGKNTSGAVQPADTAQYPESNATSCAAMLRDCRAHGTGRIGATSPG